MTTWIDRLVFRSPDEEQVFLKRPLVEGAVCPACGSNDVRRYPVATEHAARMVTKCQACMEIIALERPSAEDMWPPYRAVAYDWPASPAERASRELAERGGERQ
jgi:hypothetical protein